MEHIALPASAGSYGAWLHFTDGRSGVLLLLRGACGLMHSRLHRLDSDGIAIMGVAHHVLCCLVRQAVREQVAFVEQANSCRPIGAQEPCSLIGLIEEQNGAATSSRRAAQSVQQSTQSGGPAAGNAAVGWRQMITPLAHQKEGR